MQNKGRRFEIISLLILQFDTFRAIDAEMKTEDESVNTSADTNVEDTAEKAEKKEPKAGEHFKLSCINLKK